MNKDITSFIRPKKQTKLASKKTINLCTTEAKKKPVALLVLGIAAIAALAFCAAKFGVIDQYARAAAAEKALEDAKVTTQLLQAEAARFKSVRVEYLTYTSSWMGEVNDTSKEALVSVDRQDAIELVDRQFSEAGIVTSIHIYSTLDSQTKVSKDILEVSVVTDSMKTASNILASVREDPLCLDADLRRSSTDDGNMQLGNVESVFTVYLQNPEEGENP